MSDAIVVSLVVKPCGYLHFAVTRYLCLTRSKKLMWP